MAPVTEEQVLPRMRTICAKLPGTEEVVTYGHPGFKTAGRLYAVLEEYKKKLSLCVKVGVEGQDLFLKDPRYYLTPYIGKAMRENSGLRVFVGQGYYDFATPFFAAEYALSRTGIPQDRVQFHYYHAGHMMYVRDEDRAKLSRDIRAFIRSR